VFERCGAAFMSSEDLCAAVARETGGRLQPDAKWLKEALRVEPRRRWRAGKQVRGYFARDVVPDAAGIVTGVTAKPAYTDLLAA
jgi:hypothetical protein